MIEVLQGLWGLEDVKGKGEGRSSRRSWALMGNVVLSWLCTGWGWALRGQKGEESGQQPKELGPDGQVRC